MDLEHLDDSPRCIKVGQRTFACSPLRFRHLAKIRRHIKEQRPQPLKLAAAAISAAGQGMSVAAQESLLAKAYEDQIETEIVTDLEISQFLGTLQGMLTCMMFCIQDQEPHVNEDLLNEAFAQLKEDEIGDFFDAVVEIMGFPSNPMPQAPAKRTPGLASRTAASPSSSPASPTGSRLRRFWNSLRGN